MTNNHIPHSTLSLYREGESLEDLILWPDNFFCYREELEEWSCRSDDYKVIPFDSPDWKMLVGDDEDIFVVGNTWHYRANYQPVIGQCRLVERLTDEWKTLVQQDHDEGIKQAQQMLSNLLIRGTID